MIILGVPTRSPGVMMCDDVLSRTRGQEKEGWFRSVHGRRLEKWRFAVHMIGCRRKKHIADCRQVGVVAVLDNGRSGGLTSPPEAHLRISQ